MAWIYHRNSNNSARFVLGTSGNNPLVCFGINPSTAKPNNLDPTLTRVEKYALAHGYDSWIILNVYPQRATKPNCMSLNLDEKFHKENLKCISLILTKRNQDVLAAWGNNIRKRKYLIKCLKDINSIVAQNGCKCYCLGITNAGHPVHPLYSAEGFKLYEARSDFNMQAYCSKL